MSDRGKQLLRLTCLNPDCRATWVRTVDWAISNNAGCPACPCSSFSMKDVPEEQTDLLSDLTTV